MTTSLFRIRRRRGAWVVSANVAGHGYLECSRCSTWGAALRDVRWRATTTYEERLRQVGLGDVADELFGADDRSHS